MVYYERPTYPSTYWPFYPVAPEIYLIPPEAEQLIKNCCSRVRLVVSACPAHQLARIDTLPVHRILDDDQSIVSHRCHLSHARARARCLFAILIASLTDVKYLSHQG